MEIPKSIEAAAGGMGAVVDESMLRHVRRDIRDVQRAIKRRWITPEDAPAILGEEMLAIIKKRTTTVATEAGVVEVDNARAQVAAAGVLLEMEAQNQKDDHLVYATENAVVGDNEGGSSTVRVIVERTSRHPSIPSGDGNAPALPRGPVADDRQRPTLQRGDVRATVGQDDDGRVPSV